MENTIKNLSLSTQGKITVMLALALGGFADAAYAQGIEASSDATQVNQKNGVDIVDIARPNEQGLSHNQYNQYNVGAAGAVLNNSQVSGQSQLAGDLAANPNLQGQAARVILNEVISKNPSLLLGQQEVFGMAADYVLANPNGITCQGCGFINTPRATLLVGQPEMVGERLQGMSVGTGGASNVLSMTGKVGGAQVLDLIAPKISINSDVTAKTAVNVISGRGHVDYTDTVLRDLSEGEKSQLGNNPVILDGSVLGSISSGRIRIHNNDTRANTLIQAKLQADQSIGVAAGGQLTGVAAQFHAPEIDLSAKNVTLKGLVKEFYSNNKPTKSNQGNFVSRTVSDNISSESFTATGINGADVRIHADELADLNAVELKATNLNVEGHDVRLSTTTTREHRVQTDKLSKGLWYNQNQRDEYKEALHHNDWQVEQNANIRANGGTLSASALNLQANGEVSLSGNKIVADGVVTEKRTTLENSYINETSSLNSGKKTTSQREETYHGSRIQAKNIQMNSKQDMALEGVELQATNIGMNAEGQISLGAQAAQTTSRVFEDTKIFGGIAGGQTHENTRIVTTQNGSRLTAQSVEINGKNGVTLSGSTVTGKQSVNISSADSDVIVRHVFNHVSQLQNDRHGVTFNATDKNRKVQTESDKTVGSQISSDGAVRLSSGKNTTLVGSVLKAGQELDIRAKGNVQTDIADARTETRTEDYTFGLDAELKPNEQSDLAKGGSAKVQLAGVVRTTVAGSAQAVGTVLRGSSVNIAADNSVSVKGSQIISTQGGVKINAENVSIAAADSLSAVNGQGMRSTGFTGQASGDTSNAHLKIKLGSQGEDTRTETHRAVLSQIQSEEGIELQAVNTLQNNGTSITARGDIALSGQKVLTDAAYDKIVTRTENSDGGFFIDSALKNIQASAGVEGKGLNRQSVNATARVSNLNGRNITVRGTNVTDTGTQYHARQDVNIGADHYQGNAAANSHVQTSHAGGAAIGIKVGTNTFQDVDIAAGLKANYQNELVGQSTAVVGHIHAENVRIRAKENLSSSMHIDAAQEVVLQATNVTVAQADNRQWKQQGGFDAGLDLGAVYVPATGVGTVPTFSVNAGMNYLKVEDSQAVAAKINARDIHIQATDTARAEGAELAAVNVTMQAKNVAFDAAQDKHRAHGVLLSVNASAKPDVAKASLGAGGITLKAINETSVKRHGGSIAAQNVTLTADSSEQDLLLNGANIRADKLNLVNKSGNIAILAAQSTVEKGNVDMDGEVNLGVADKKVDHQKTALNLKFDVENSKSYESGTITAKDVHLSSAGNLVVQGNLNAAKLHGEIGKDIRIESVQNQQNAFKFETSAAFNTLPKIENNNTAPADQVAGNIGGSLKNSDLLNLGVSGKLDVQIKDNKQTQVTRVDVGEMDLKPVSGSVFVQAAQVKNQSGKGFSNAHVVSTGNYDKAFDAGVTLSAQTPNLKDSLNDLAQGKNAKEMFNKLIQGESLKDILGKTVQASGHYTNTTTQIESDVQIK